MFMQKQRYRSGLLGVGLMVLSGCDSSAVPPPTTVAPVAVSVLQLQPTSLTVTADLPGRVAPLRSAEIRAQVSGIVQERLFTQGADVAAGAVLYQINPAPFAAEVASAAAVLQKAEAVAARAALEANRLASLRKTGVISRQLYDDAVALQAQAVADVAFAKAAWQRRQLDLQFARVTAPIRGRIDQTLVSEGALVSPADSLPMARIQQIDQVYLDVRLTASLLPAFRQAQARQSANVAEPNSQGATLPVDILSSSGAVLGIKGRVLFSGSDVDSGTGDVLLRVLVDNSEHHLLPGLHLKARLPLAHYPAALLIPQQALIRSNGQPAVWLLTADNQVQLVPVEVAELVNGQYRLIGGVQAGQQVVVAGIERLSPAVPVQARPWSTSQSSTVVSAQVQNSGS